MAFAIRQIGRALRQRPAPRVIGLAALALAATLVTALLAFERAAPAAVEATLARSGPNVTVVAAPGMPYLTADAAARIERLAAARGVRASTRLLVGSGEAVDDAGRAIRVPILGVASTTDAVYPAWTLTGTWPLSGARTCVVGDGLRRVLGAATGSSLAVAGPGGPADLRITGVVVTGGPEDDAALTDLATAGAVLGVQGRVSVVALRAPGGAGNAERLAAAIGARAPGVDARVVRRVAEADRRMLALVRLLLGLGTATILVLSALALSATLASLVGEREREIALLRALGADGGRVTALFAGEASVVAIAAGVLGYAAGAGLAALLGRSLLGVAIHAPLPLLGVATGVALVLAAAAGALPLSRALGVQPAAALRGE